MRLTALAVMAAAMTGIAGAAPGAQQRTAMSPETFGRVESGVALVRPADCGGKRGVQGPAATGFLVGSQVLMTASRVVSAAIAQRCRMQVRLGGRWYGATSAKAWFDARSKARDVDIATLELARPAPGYLFRIARALPRRNDAVAALGHPLGLPLNLQQGLFRRAVAAAGVPSVVARVVAGEGNVGGPIVNGDGDAIGVVSRTAVPEEDARDAGYFVGGVDLVQWFGASAADLCRAHPQGGIPACSPDAAQSGPRRWVPLNLATGSGASASWATIVGAVSPATFARVASGVALVRSSDCERGGGVFGSATGFLVGSQVVMTAKHVLNASPACRIQVRLGGSWFEVAFAKAWYDARSKVQDVDLATLKLTRPAPGYVFRLARTLPRRNDTVATLGHPLGLPLNLQQGLFRRAVVSRGVPSVVTRLAVEGGNSGGPIVDTNGDVIGVVSRIAFEEDPAQAPNLVAGPNLAEWFVASASRDLCRAYPRGGIPDCRTDSARPGPRRWVSLRLRRG